MTLSLQPPAKPRLAPRFALAMAAFALLGSAPAGIAQAPVTAEIARGDIALPEAEAIQMQADRNLRMTVPVTIGEAGPFRFMVDTGSQATAITSELGEQLALEVTGQAILVGMASRRTVDLVELDRIGLGSSTFDNIEAPVLERRNVGADGILGLDYLQDFRVLLDFRDNTISLAEAKDSRGQRGYEIVVRARRKRNQLVITDAVVDGVKTAVIIDTGAQSSVGNLALRNRIRARRSGEVTTTDVNGVQMVGEITVARNVEIDDLQLSNLVIAFVDAPGFAALGYTNRPVLSLGMQHLRMFDRVAIDFDRRRVLFDMPRGSRRTRRDFRDPLP